MQAGRLEEVAGLALELVPVVASGWVALQEQLLEMPEAEPSLERVERARQS